MAHLVGREFKLRYRRSVLGWLWAILQPLIRLATLSFIFTQVLPVEGQEGFAAFLFTGIVVFTWFQSGVSQATASLIDRRELVFRPGLARGTVPLVSVLTDALDLLVALPVLVVFVGMSVEWHATALLLPIPLLLQGFLILGLGGLFSVANVFVRDVKLLIDVFLGFAFYLTPIFYRPEQVPERFQWMIDVNPMAKLLDLNRALLVEGRVPTAGELVPTTIICVTVFLVGWAVFHRVSHSVVDEL